MSQVEHLLNDSDEFLIVTMKKNNDAELDVGVVMGFDPEGPMLDVLDNVLKDARDAAKSNPEHSPPNGDKAQSYGDPEAGLATTGR